MPRPLRAALVLLPALVFAVAAVIFLVRAPAGLAPEPTAPVATDPGAARAATSKLVVVVVFDQMRGDYLDRWAAEFGRHGFEAMKRGGVWYRDAHLPHGCTSTGPGHAGLGTGQPPSVHGIVENRWFDRASGREVAAASGDRRYRRIPEVPGDDGAGFAPDRLLCEGIGDELARAEGGNARVFSLSLKDRAAALMGGKRPTGVYAFDTAKGEFHTSSYYAEAVPAWVAAFNGSGKADAWFGQNWDRLGTAAAYDRAAGPDDVAAEGVGVHGQGRTFPHPLSLGQAIPNKRYYDALENSAHGNDLLWAFAQACLDGERLGRGATRDLLFVSFSSNDLVGHAWGPDSHEVLDITLRSDRIVGELLHRLATTVGIGNYTLIVTADHGVCPMPELAARDHPEAARFDPQAAFAGLGAMLDEKFGPVGATPDAWVRKLAYPDIYLNRTAMAAAGKPVGDVEAVVAEWAGNRDAMLVAYTRTALGGPPLADPLARRMQLGFHPDRSGDVIAVGRPYGLPTGALSRGSNHGGPHAYDTHVPVLLFGGDIGERAPVAERASASVAAEQIRRSLGLAR